MEDVGQTRRSRGVWLVEDNGKIVGRDNDSLALVCFVNFIGVGVALCRLRHCNFGSTLLAVASPRLRFNMTITCLLEAW